MADLLRIGSEPPAEVPPQPLHPLIPSNIQASISNSLSDLSDLVLIVDDVGEELLDSGLPGGISERAAGMGTVARFGQNLFGERQWVESMPGRMVAAGMETLAEDGARRVMDQAVREQVGALGSIGGRIVGLVDSRLDEGSSFKLATASIVEANPSTVASNASSLLVDAAVITVSGNATNAAHLSALEGDLLQGEYGAVLQGAAATGAAFSDRENASRHLASETAARGDAGVFVALGNAIGDLWADVLHGEVREPRVIPLNEVDGW